MSYLRAHFWRMDSFRSNSFDLPSPVSGTASSPGGSPRVASKEAAEAPVGSITPAY